MKTEIKSNRFWSVCLAFCTLCLLGGCERSYLWYDAEQKDGIWFFGCKDTTNATRLDNGAGEWVLSRERMDIIGFATDYDRHFKVEIVDSLTTIPADKYRFADTCYIPANSNFGMLTYYTARSEDTLTIGLRLVENEHFRPVMQHQVCFLLLPNTLSEPTWWKASDYMFGKPWTAQLHELMLKFYKNVEQTEPYIWSTYFKPNLGENLEKGGRYLSGWVTKYWQAPYEDLLRKYVARPLYNYLKEHPEDGDPDSMPYPFPDVNN